MARHVHAIGFDDSPFEPSQRGDVAVVGAICSRLRLDGIVVGRVRRDGANATTRLARLLNESRWADHAQVILLEGIALAGFNVVDVPALSRSTGLPVLVVARRKPDLAAMRRALEALPGGRRKWCLIEKLGPMRQADAVYVQSVGLTDREVRAVLTTFRARGHVPEPLRIAHMIAGALTHGVGRGRT